MNLTKNIDKLELPSAGDLDNCDMNKDITTQAETSQGVCINVLPQMELNDPKTEKTEHQTDEDVVPCCSPVSNSDCLNRYRTERKSTAKVNQIKFIILIIIIPVYGFIFNKFH